MRLSQICLKNFRSCEDMTIRFAEDLTVLVGENGSGKSNIIDAIRLVVAPVSGKRQYYFNDARDLNRNATLGTPVSINTRFSELTEFEQAVFTPQLVNGIDDLTYTTTFDTNPSTPYRFKIIATVGLEGLHDPEPHNRGRIASVYLPPLRDAHREFDSSEGNRLAEILSALGDEDSISDFTSSGNNALKDLQDHSLTSTAQATIQSHLTEITHPARLQLITIDTRDQDITRPVRALQLRMAEVNIAPTDISRSGLGYANLLYIATIVIELEKAKNHDLTLLLVEEPEAHLHPQLQSVLLSYLKTKARESAQFSRSSTDPSPSGRIQVIVTSHSPNLTSAVSSNNLVVVKQPQLSRSFPGTHTISLSDTPLSPKSRRKIDRYLTVTRSSLLFARQVILVEGMAESILIRTIAENIVYKQTSDEQRINKMHREQYQSISIIAIDGVDFTPYLKILLGGALPLADKVTVVTDGDPSPNGPGAGELRKSKYEKDYSSYVEDEILKVHVGQTTLESDFLSYSANEPILKKCYLEQHRQSQSKWEALVIEAPNDQIERALYFHDTMKRDKDFLDKGEFAHKLAEMIEEDSISQSLCVPEYLSRAITFTVID